MPDDFKVDVLSREIIAILQEDARTTNKDIGDRLGVSEVTVAGRIRNLEEAKSCASRCSATFDRSA